MQTISSVLCVLLTRTPREEPLADLQFTRFLYVTATAFPNEQSQGKCNMYYRNCNFILNKQIVVRHTKLARTKKLINKLIKIKRAECILYVRRTKIKEFLTARMSYCNNIMIEHRKSLPYNNNYTVKLVCIIIFVNILFRDFIFPYLVYFLLYFFCMSTIYHYSIAT